MSPEDEYSVEISINHDEHAFRLLELSPLLLESIHSKNAPILHLKSPVRSLGNPAPNAVLCTPSQTFEVRQVQSSNILYVLETAEVTTSDNADKAAPVTGVSAIGQCKALLELVSVPTKPDLYLRHSVPGYYALENLQTGVLGRARKQNREQILDNAPFSTGEFDAAWRRLCAFEVDREAWWPAASMLRSLWSSILSAAAVKEMDVTEAFRAEEITTLVEEDEFPKELLSATLGMLASGEQDLMDSYVKIDRSRCIAWLGMSILEARGYKGDNKVATFLREWQDQLPESWRDQARTEMLEQTRISLQDEHIFYKGDMTENDLTAALAANISKGTNKWHEKFKGARS